MTLTGPGGVGKTRLAFEVARPCRHPGGAVSSSWPRVRTRTWCYHGGAGPRVAGAGGRGAQGAGHLLRHATPLLVLDNAEHLLAAAGDRRTAGPVPRPDGAGHEPGTAADAGRSGNAVAPLAVPDPRRTRPPSGRRPRPGCSSTAPEAGPAGSADRGDAAAVAAICWRLDGLPLALELVAPAPGCSARPRCSPASTTPSARRGPGSARTAATDAGDAGLEPRPAHRAGEQRLLRGLAVFIGGFTLDAAEAVTGPRRPGGARRAGRAVAASSPTRRRAAYRLLEPVRQYAAARLAGDTGRPARPTPPTSGDLGDSAPAGAAAAAQRGGWTGCNASTATCGRRWPARRARPGRRGVLAGRTWLYWALRGHADEGSRWAERILARELADAARGLVLGGAAAAALRSGDVAGMAAAAGESRRGACGPRPPPPRRGPTVGDRVPSAEV